MAVVHIFTDGSSRGNPGPGGYGTILRSGNLEKELSEGYRKTTNNRMELLAIIKGLESLKKPGTEVIVTSDSKYVVDAVRLGWVFGWEKKGFKGKKNPDLWRRFLIIYRKHKVKFEWIRGHIGHPENERCDELATYAADFLATNIDHGFEDSLDSGQIKFND